jgi:hypothetical protein
LLFHRFDFTQPVGALQDFAGLAAIGGADDAVALHAIQYSGGTAVAEAERLGEPAVHVVDARSADAKPKAVKGNPMLEIERKYNEKVAREKKEAEQAAKAKPAK